MTPYRLLRLHAPSRRALLVSALLLSALPAPLLAVLVPVGAAAADACIEVDLSDLEQAVDDAEMIVIGEVLDGPSGGRVVIRPEAYLKGPAEAAEIILVGPVGNFPCTPADLPVGNRVLLLLESGEGAVRWPGAGASFLLAGGRAQPGDGQKTPVDEAQLVAEITAITDQYAVPATADEGASLDLGTAIVPVAATLTLLFCIGLVLMRIWHRIDPS